MLLTAMDNINYKPQRNIIENLLESRDSTIKYPHIPI